MTAERSYAKSIARFDEALDLIPGGTQTNSKRPGAFAWGAYPIYLASGKGGHVADIDGNTFIDLVSGLGPVSLGYAYPAVDVAIRAQLDAGIITSLPTTLEVEVARLLVELVPCAEQVRFFKGGGEATAAAARVARRFTGRSLILNCGYRGWPDVWTAANSDGGVPEAFSQSIASFPFNDREAVEALVAAHPGEVAAIAIDVQVTAPEPGYLAWLRDLAHEIGAMLIFDEIVTGFRLARGGAQEYFGVTPDLAVFAKGIANGMPLAAVTGRADMMTAMTDATISITYGTEALSLAAAKAALTVYRDEPVIETLHARGLRLREGLSAAACDAGLPFVVAGFDPMTAMRFTGLDPATDHDAWTYLLQEMAARGVLLRRGGLNFVSYSHTEADIDAVIVAAREVFPTLARLLEGGLVREYLRVRGATTSPAYRTFS